MLTSISATERIKLWDKFTAPVDQEAIKLEFFRKISRKNPPFRIKVRLPRKNRAIIPPMVKYHYEKPAKLLPSLRDVLRIESIYGQQQQQQQYQQQTVKSEIMTDDEDETRNCENGDETDVLFSGCYEMNGNGSSSESVFNGVVKTEGEVFNGVDAVKKEVFLPDVVTDVSSEGKVDSVFFCFVIYFILQF